MSIIIESALTNPDYARICYSNIARSATITASSETSGFEAENVQNALTWNFWRPTSVAATIVFDLGTAQDVDYCGIAAHNCGTKGNTITIAYSSNNSTWTNVDDTTPTDDSVILFLFTQRNYRYWRITISGGTAPDIGVIYLGTQLTMQRSTYGGHTPITLSKKTSVRPQKSEGGQWLGRSKIRQGAQTNLAFKNLTASWVRTYFEPFIDSAIDYPFFFAWRPTSYTDEVAYCWTAGDISVGNSGQADLMDTSFAVDGMLE